MRIDYGFDTISCGVRSVVTIGSFDGVHSGHKVLLRSLKQMAADMGLSYPTVRNILDNIIEKLKSYEENF